jgi:type I restriction enzyme S subunit
MNIVGPPLGKIAILPGTYPEWNINQAITLFRPSSLISSSWIYLVLCEGEAIRSVMDRTKGSVGQVNISLSQCRAFDFPVPSIDEQDEIVRRVESLFAFADRLEARLSRARTAAERLTPALLAKAFRGELVPQDPEDEPAAELLKRLAAGTLQNSAKRTRRTSATAAASPATAVPTPRP